MEKKAFLSGVVSGVVVAIPIVAFLWWTVLKIFN